MSKPDDGGPAFPMHPDLSLHDNNHTGMSLRDWFAGQALSTLVANDIANPHSFSDKGETIAGAAYEIADAMLRARKT
jgi:hypothetical protein